SVPLDPALVPSEFESWSDATEVGSLQRFDVGIMPLRGDEQSWGRCGLKALQYMAVGVPVVATPVGAARQIPAEGAGGALATTADEWTRALGAFADDQSLRVAVGARARRRVEDAYSVSVVSRRLARALEAVVG